MLTSVLIQLPPADAQFQNATRECNMLFHNILHRSPRFGFGDAVATDRLALSRA